MKIHTKSILAAGMLILSHLGASAATYYVYATREGLQGSKTANGHIIGYHDHFVALPSGTVLDSNGGSTYTVSIQNPANGRVANNVPVWDVGPWNTKDNYWHAPRAEFGNLPLGLPEAQAAYQDGYNGGHDEFGRVLSNPAGIDLADGTFLDDLGMSGNGWVYVTYNWEPACNYPLVGGAIKAHYDSLGGCDSFLGGPTTGETGTPDGIGRYNHFANHGSIYWTPNYGAWSIHGLIRDHWASLGWETSPLGYPVTDEAGTPDGIGRFNHFQVINGSAGSIYWTGNYGAWSIRGAIRDKWSSLGWENSVLGYPVTDENVTPDNVGHYNHFKNPHQGDLQGSIYWTPNFGAHEIHGSIRDKWSSLGWEGSMLGYPVTDEAGTPDGVGRYNHFQTLSQSSPGGSIYWTGSTGAHEVHGPIRTQWANMGWERSSLGYPTSDQFALNDGTSRVRNNFQNGTITYNPTTGQVTVP